MRKILKISFKVMIIIIVYITYNVIMYQQIIVPFAHVNKHEIIKKTVKNRDLIGKKYIVCKWVRTTGYNYQLIRDENGIRRFNTYCKVTGISPEDELIYEMLISNNTYILYVVEKRQYKEMKGIEYIVDGWDVLYPAKRDELFNFSSEYILKNDLNEYNKSGRW